MKVENDNRFHSAILEVPSDPITRRLSEVPLNRWFIIDRLDGPCDDCNRLLDLGFTPGEEIVVSHAAPLGDPLVIRVRGALLALRKREARMARLRNYEGSGRLVGSLGNEDARATKTEPDLPPPLPQPVDPPKPTTTPFDTIQRSMPITVLGPQAVQPVHP